MATLQQLRSMFPSGKSDEDVLSLAAKQFGMNPVDIANDVGYDPGNGGLTSKRIGSAVDSYQSNWYGLGGAAARAVGMPGVGKWMDEGRDDNKFQSEIGAQRAKAMGGVDDWRDITGVGSAANYVGGLAAQSLPYLAEAPIGGLAARGLMAGTRAALAGAQTVEAATAARRALNTGSVVGGAAASYPSAVGDILSNQREENGGEKLGMAALGGVPYAALNAFGVEGMLARGVRPRDLLQGGTLARVGKAAGITALEEGASETGQEMVNQSFGRMAVNSNQTMFNPEANKRYLDSFVGGAALGGVMGGAGGFRGREQARPIGDNEQRDLLTTSPGAAPDKAGTLQTTANPLGDITPDWGAVQGFEPRVSGIDPVGLYRAIDEPRVGPPQDGPLVDGYTPGRNGPGSLIPGMEFTPGVMGVAPGGMVLGNSSENELALADFSQDPGAEMARQQWLDKRSAEAAKVQAQQQQAQELQVEAQRQQGEKARIESLGVPAKGDNHKLYQELEALRDEGTITPAQFTENAAKIVGETPVDRNGARKFVRDVVKAQQPKTETTRTASIPTAQEVTDAADTPAPPADPLASTLAKLQAQAPRKRATVVPVASANNQEENYANAEKARGTGVVVPTKNGTVELIHLKSPVGDEAVVALDAQGKAVGETGFVSAPGFNPDVGVEASAQRQGVATAMYDYIEGVLGVEFKKDGRVQTGDGAAFNAGRDAKKAPKAPVSSVPTTSTATETVAPKTTSGVLGLPATTGKVALPKRAETSLAVAGIEPGKSITVGRTDRRQTVTAVALYEKLVKAPEKIKQRMLLALGYEVDTNPDTGAETMIQRGNLRTFEQVAAIEAHLTGQKVTRQAIAQSLQGYGITEDAINRTAGGAAPDTVSDAEVGLTLSEGGESAMPGMRVETSAAKAFSAGMTEGGGVAPTKKQRQTEKDAGSILKEDAGRVKRAASDGEVLDAGQMTDQEAEAARAETNQGHIDAMAEATLATVEAEDVLNIWQDSEVNIRDMPRRLQASWVTSLLEISQEARKAEGDFDIEKAVFDTLIELKKEHHDITDRLAKNARVPGIAGGGKKVQGAIGYSEAGGSRAPDERGSRAPDGRSSGTKPDVEPDFSSIQDLTQRANAKWKHHKGDFSKLDGAEVQAVADRATKFNNSALADTARAELERRATAKTNADVLGPDTATAAAINRDVIGPGIPNVAINSDAAQFSKATQGAGSKAAELEADLKAFMRVGAFGSKVTVVQSMADLPAGIQRSVNPTADTQGFVVNGKAYLIADNIAPGRKARAVLLHEVGAHLGLENLLGAQQYAALVSKVKQWAAKADGSQESKIAQAAQQRVTDAGTDATQADSELVAYFIEEAVDAGIDPTATQGNTEFGRWFRSLWAAFKKAMHTLGVNPDKLTAQDVVDMAYGAAKLEATGTFHGTAGEFRKFDHKYMGSGEGAQAFGWGSYFAQDLGIAKGYWKKDVRNKTGAGDAKVTAPPNLTPEERDVFDHVVGPLGHGTVGKFNGYLNSAELQNLPTAQRSVVEAVAVKIALRGDVTPDGNLMRVDFNVADDEWLDLDKPLSGQSAKVRKILADERRNYGGNDKDASGRDLYNDLEAELDSDKAASEYLDSIGIKGNRFLDANSRGGRNIGQYPALAELKAVASKEDYLGFGDWADMMDAVETDGMQKTRAQYAMSPALDAQLSSMFAWKNEATGKTSNFVVFNDKNIQRVSSMKAADRNRVSFSKAAKPQSMQQFSDSLPGRVADLWDSFKTLTDEVSVKAMFTQDLINRAAKVLPSATKYLKAMVDIQIERGKAERAVADVVEDFRALPAHERGMGPSSVNAFLKESTMTGKWAFAPSWVPGAVVDPALKARFEGSLSPKAQELVKRVFQRGHDSLVAMQTAAVANADSEYNALIAEATKAGDAKEVAALTSAKAKSLKDFQGLLAIHKGTPYAPLKRFGNYVVMAVSQEYKAASEAGDTKRMQEMQRNGDHYHIEFTDTNREARARARVLESAFPGGFVGKMEKGDDGLMMGGRDMLGAFGRLRKVMADSVVDNPNVDKATGKRIDDMMRQLYLTLLSETSARKGEIHRKNVAGANDDMMRAFATQGRATAHFIAGLKTSGKVDDHLAGMRNETKALNSGREERTRYYNEIVRRHSLSLEYKPSPMIDQAMAGTSAMMLLTNPSYHLMNALQPGMMTIPVLAGRHGYAKSWAALTRAYTELGPILKAREFTEKSYSALPADVRQAIEDLANMGKIDIMLDADLGRVESASDSAVKRPFVVASEWLKGISQDVESMNRLSSAIAAFRLEKGRPGTTHEQAVKYASEVIYETHGDYSGFNAPRFMRSGAGRLMTQFKKFQLIQISLFARLASRSWRDDPAMTPAQNAEAKTAARYALTYTLAHLLAMGGVMGLPGFAAIAWVVGKVWPGDDEPDDPEATLRRASGNDALADFLLQGIPAFAGVNVSGRIGAGGMLSLLPYTDVDMSRKSYPEMVVASLGPFIGGVLPRALGGLEMMRKGELVKGTEAMLPNGLGNALKAYRFGTEGVSKGNGDTLMSPADLNALDILGQAFGLPTTKISDRTTENASQYKAEQFYKDRTGELKQRYTKAAKSNDADALRDLRTEWTNTQAARKELGFKPSPLSDLLKSPQEQRKREMATAGGVQFNKGNKGFREALQ